MDADERKWWDSRDAIKRDVKVCPACGHEQYWELDTTLKNKTGRLPCYNHNCKAMLERYEEGWIWDWDGCANELADKVERVDKCWGSGLNDYFDAAHKFNRLKCRGCGGTSFEVLGTDHYETTAQCVKCGLYYVVHSG